MKIQILIFGQLADVVGRNQIETECADDTDALKKNLFLDFPELKNQPFVLSVDRKIVKHNQKINPEAEVALLPPFAGG